MHAQKGKILLLPAMLLSLKNLRSFPGRKHHGAMMQCTDPPKEGAVSQKVLDSSAANPQTSHEYPPCKMCKQAHSIMRCPDFKALKVSDRAAFICTHKLCVNCFRDNHSVTECS